MANPGGGAAGAPEKDKPPKGTQEDMAGQPTKPLVELSVTEYIDNSDPQNPKKVCNILITTRDDSDKKEKKSARIQITSNGDISETDTSADEKTVGTLRPSPITLQAGEEDIAYRVDNLTYGGTAQTVLKAPPKPPTKRPKPKGAKGQVLGFLAGVRGEIDE